MATTSYARNHLSKLLRRVRRGESVLILDRRVPVACLTPPAEDLSTLPEWRAEILRGGAVRPARQPFDTAALNALDLPVPSAGGDVLAALLHEREDGR